jgi:hypothetical protein
MKIFISSIVLFLSLCAACADMVAMSEQERNLKEKLAGEPTSVDVIAAFNSSHHLVYAEAIKWMILNRDLETWGKVNSEKSKLKGVAYHLYPILDFMTENPLPPDTPLVLALNQEYLKMLAKKEAAPPIRYEYSYIEPPLDEVLYEILARDIEQSPSKNHAPEAANVLLQYRAPSDNLEAAMRQISLSSNKSPDSINAPLGPSNSNHRTGAPNPIGDGHTQQSTTQKNTTATFQWKIVGLVVTTAFILFAAILKLLKSAK